MQKRKAPKGCYWRGDTLYGRVTIKGEEHRWSLRTNDVKLAPGRRRSEAARLTAELRFGEKGRRTWEDAVMAWGAQIAASVSPKTVKRYAVSLKQVNPKLRGHYLDEIDRALMNELVRERQEGGASTATIRRDLTAVSRVLDFCEGEEWPEVTSNPALVALKRLKERRDPIVLPDPADIEYVIARAPGLLAAMIRMAWRTGARQEELVTLERRRVDLKRRQAVLIGKRNKLRTIDLHAAYEALRAIPVNLRSPFVFWHGGAGEPYANVASRFAEITESALKTAQKEGREFRRFPFHHLRHRFAVDFLKNRLGSIYDLQIHLGHESVKTTEIYLKHLTAEEARWARSAPAQK